MGFENRDYMREEPAGAGRLSQYSMVTILIAINVIVFLLDAFTDGGHAIGNWLSFRVPQWYYLWTWLTNGFAHAPLTTRIGVWHIFGNMLGLFFIGPAIERRLGRYEFLKFYLLAIVAGTAGFALEKLLLGGVEYSVLGASGAVTAVVALFVVYYPDQRVLFMGVIEMPTWVIGVIMVGSNLIHALNPESQVAWSAHAGGGLFGYCYYRFQWSFSAMTAPAFVKRFASGQPNLKLHDPDDSPADQRLREQADKVLEKVARHGEESLTRAERRTLNRYSKMIRKNRES